jgi:hypothetical protein
MELDIQPTTMASFGGAPEPIIIKQVNFAMDAGWTFPTL